MRKILAFTSIRSDYDLMSPLYALLNDDPEIDFRIIVSGAHLSSVSGYSVRQVREDGLEILLEIETLLNSDTGLSRVKSASLLLQNMLETINRFSPEIMVYAGDREDVLMYAFSAGYLNIPSAHFYSGDHVADGYIDNPVRHAASKLSSVHFVALEEHKRRLVRMGESESRVHVTGNLSLDRFVEFKPDNKEELKKTFAIKGDLDVFSLLIFHPVTDELDNADVYFENILNNLEKKNIKAFVSYPNVDPGCKKILDVIERYASKDNFIFYKNLERSCFLSIYKNADFIIGNSSSGICEAASMKMPAINVGKRQTGRHADKNVIFCGVEFNEIDMAIELALSKQFRDGLKDLTNSYGNGGSAKKAYDLIKEIDFKSYVEKIEDPLSVELL